MPVQLTNCVLCKKPESEFRPFETVRGWNYVRCAGCGFVFLNPQPTSAELGCFYNHSYRYDRTRYSRAIPRETRWLDVLARACQQPGTLLEVGCSYGHFLAAARERGWTVRGIELSESAVRFAQGELGLPVERGRILDLVENFAACFDAIAAWHVLEHDPFPHKFVDTAYELLRPGGILAVRVPNLGSLVAKLSGPDWQWLSPPEHVCMYTPDTLSELLKQARFEMVASQTARGNARNTWFEILRARMKTARRHRKNGDGDEDRHGISGEPFSFSPPPVYQDRAWYRAAEGLITLGTMPFDWAITPWLSRKGQEAELAVIARKPGLRYDTESVPKPHLEEVTV
jgi:SAM-dependent methyltransferase